jgi:hypothetical protein
MGVLSRHSVISRLHPSSCTIKLRTIQHSTPIFLVLLRIFSKLWPAIIEGDGGGFCAPPEMKTTSTKTKAE